MHWYRQANANWYKKARYFNTEFNEGYIDPESSRDVYDLANEAEKVFNQTGVRTKKDISQIVMPDLQLPLPQGEGFPAPKHMKVGIVGYSTKSFDEEKAESLLKQIFDYLPKNSTIISGLTNIGIHAIAYKLAKERGMKTVGYACSKGKEYEPFPVDETNWIGSNWGDESDAFLADIDMLVRIGGGNQSKAEAEKAKKLLGDHRVIEIELEAN